MRWEQEIQGRMRRHFEELGVLNPGASVGVRGWANAEVKVAASGREIVVVATTDAIDLADEVVVPAGLDLTHFEANRSVFLDHDYRSERCVGKMRRIDPYPSSVDFRGFRARVAMLPTLLADEIFRAAEMGMGPGASIGFEAIDRGPPTEEEGRRYGKSGRAPRAVIRKAKMLELSLTYMPCNVECQGVATISEARMADLDTLVTKGVMRRSTAVALGLPDAKPLRRLILTEHGGLLQRAAGTGTIG